MTDGGSGPAVAPLAALLAEAGGFASSRPLLGRLLGHDEVPIYGSCGFTTYDDETARTQLEQWVVEWEIPRAKIKIGEGGPPGT